MERALPSRTARPLGRSALLVLALATGLGAALVRAAAGPERVRPLPRRLSETGLFVEGSTTRIAAGNLTYAPQYPLWSDGATKRRFMRLPDGGAIDARDPDQWQFPVGTRFWKEFSVGRRVETRFIERVADGSYRFASYVWAEDGGDAWLAPDGARVTLPDGSRHDVPAQDDCRACHDGRRTPILGVNALQLSHDRDPLAPHREATPPGGVDLKRLAAAGQLTGVSAHRVHQPPRIDARSPRERAALGYLYGNCSGCHNARGPLASLGLDFDQHVQRAAGERPRTPLPSALGVPSGFAIPDVARSLRIAPRRPELSAVAYRMGSRFPATQMPPLGTRRVDEQALALVRSWITHDLTEAVTQ